MKRNIIVFLAMFWFIFMSVACVAGGGASGTSGTNLADMSKEEKIELDNRYVSGEGYALMAGSRHAVNDLVSSLTGILPQGAGVLVASFVDAENLNNTSSLGSLLAAQFSTGLTDAAYMVKESRLRADLALRPGRGEFALSREAAALARQSFDVSAVLYGYYIVDRDSVYVSARVALTEDGSIAAAEDYALLNRRAVSRLLGNDHDALFNRYLHRPMPVHEAALQSGLEERDLIETPAREAEPAFRIFPPRRLNP